MCRVTPQVDPSLRDPLPSRWIPLYGILGSKGLQDMRHKYPKLKLDTCYKCRQSHSNHIAITLATSAGVLLCACVPASTPLSAAVHRPPMLCARLLLTFEHQTLSEDLVCNRRLLIAFTVEEVASRLPPRVKAIGPCSDPAREVYVLRFDLLQEGTLLSTACHTLLFHVQTLAHAHGHLAIASCILHTAGVSVG